MERPLTVPPLFLKIHHGPDRLDHEIITAPADDFYTKSLKAIFINKGLILIRKLRIDVQDRRDLRNDKI
jgi:hypothetical protein